MKPIKKFLEKEKIPKDKSYSKKKIYEIEYRVYPVAWDKGQLVICGMPTKWKLYCKKYSTEKKRDQAIEQLSKGIKFWKFYEYRAKK